MVTKKLITPSRRGGKPQHTTRPAVRMKPYPVHALARVVPAMSPADFEDLKRHIREHGLVCPITLHEGKVLDGAHRQQACVELGLPLKTEVWQQSDGMTPAAYVLGMNLTRRHLTVGQRADLALKLAADVQRRFPSHRKRGGADLQKAAQHLGVKLPPKTRGKKVKVDVLDLVAPTVHVSPQSVENYRALTKDAPDLAKQVAAGTLALDAASKQRRRQKSVAPAPSPAVFRTLKLVFPQNQYEHVLRRLDRVRKAVPELKTTGNVVLHLLTQWEKGQAPAVAGEGDAK